MTITYNDAFGAVVDTGSGTQRTFPSANESTEFHTVLEIDTGSKLTPVTSNGVPVTGAGSVIPHFSPWHPQGSPR